MCRQELLHLRSLVLLGVPIALGVLPNRDFDSLAREALAQGRALDHTRELLGGVDLEFVRVDEGEDGGAGFVEAADSGVADVDEVHAESVK